MSLTEIGTTFGTDKVQHQYTDLYEKYLGHLKDSPISLMEIGVYQGKSLKMWEAYFTQGSIYGVDDCTLVTADALKAFSTDRIKTFVADQSKREQLQTVVDAVGALDVIVDDGLHYQEHQQISWGFLFPALKPGGVFVIEDLCPREYTGGWGIRDTKTFTDITTNVLEGFRSFGKVSSPYMKPEEMESLNCHIDKIEIHYINQSSIIAFIWKKA